MSQNGRTVTTPTPSPTEYRIVDWLRTHPPFIIDYEQLRSGFKFKPTYARKIIQRMVRKGLIKRITYGIFELTEKPLIPQVREAERHILSTVGDVVGGPPHVNGLQLTTALGRRGSKAFDRIRASLSKPSRSPIDWRLHRCKNTLYLQKKDIKFPGGWFTLRLFRSGTLNVYVTAKRSGLDSRGLIDLLNRIAVEVHTFSGRYVYAEDLKLRGPTEENFDTQDPRFRKMLEVQDVKSIKTYSTLLHCYLRIYDKCGRVRVETGGYPANASLLARTLCTPVSAIENLATLPVLLDALEDRLAAKWQVLQAGMSQVLQQVEEVKQQIKEASESRA